MAQRASIVEACAGGVIDHLDCFETNHKNQHTLDGPGGCRLPRYIGVQLAGEVERLNLEG